MSTEIHDKEYLREAAKAIQSKLPDMHRFILLAAPIGDEDGRRLVYVSNIERKCAINLLKEWLIKASGEEEWMKHIQ